MSNALFRARASLKCFDLFVLRREQPGGSGMCKMFLLALQLFIVAFSFPCSSLGISVFINIFNKISLMKRKQRIIELRELFLQALS